MYTPRSPLRKLIRGMDAPGTEYYGLGTFASPDQVDYNMVQIKEALRNQKIMDDCKNKLYNYFKNATK